MQLKPEEISKLIKEQIKHYENRIAQDDVGTTIMIGDGIARVSGLDKCMANELVQFPNGAYGMALNLEENSVAVVMLGDDEDIKEGDVVKRTGHVVSVPVGEGLIGRVVNALGQPVDGKGPVDAKEHRPIEHNAPGIIERKGVSVPLQTGIKAIDSMIPIGRGQRELIIGDRQTGKTAIAMDTIINQKGKDVICIYVAIGQKRSTVAQLVETLTAARRDGLHHRGRAPPRRELAPLQYIAPYSGCAMAEYFMDQGKDVLIVYDDLSQARGGLPRPVAAASAVRRDVRRIPAMCSICTPVCWSARRRLTPRMRRRFHDGPAHHRDPGGRRIRLHPHQRHLHHRRPDLPGDRAVPLRRHARL